MESLADETGSQSLTAENKAWENKKRKLLRASRRDQVDLNIYMPINERSESASKRIGGSRLMELRGMDAKERNRGQVCIMYQG